MAPALSIRKMGVALEPLYSPATMYIAADGDDTGRLLELNLLRDQAEDAAAFSQAVAQALLDLRQRFEAAGARIVFAAGDSLLATIDEPFPGFPPTVSGPVTWSFGVGRTPSEALLALKIAKGLGRNRVAYYR